MFDNITLFPTHNFLICDLYRIFFLKSWRNAVLEGGTRGMDWGQASHGGGGGGGREECIVCVQQKQFSSYLFVCIYIMCYFFIILLIVHNAF